MLAIPPVKKLAVQAGAIDQPGRRKVHTQATPKLGGLAMLLGIVVSLLLVNLFHAGVFNQNTLIILGGALLAAGLGFLDDVYSLQPPVKLLGQLLIAILAVACGIEINFLRHPISLQIIELGIWGKVISVLWLLIVMNIINLSDGLDGLAGGLVFISALSLFIISLLTNQLHAVFLFSAICGAALGFLRFNFPPASIFMGDTGSLLLGFLLGACSIEGVLKSATLISLAIPAISLLIPLSDTALAILRRAKKRVHIFKADKEHLHHRLLNYHASQQEAVVRIYYASIALNVLAIILAVSKDLYSILLFLVIIFGLLIVAVKIHLFFRNNQ
ncbi:MAG: undecaprenyl/decaprenyl-phosphate alpha-N-acetylglucosaminyl 1-phosphate transferase [Candidatus Margulisbacteria bacterium]|jgi:UDP-GlcNAc:undecaprenyl-phosphate GlcNAc-1-phosphate transferase|nr:undecaprenyl/decaprenyl-phosphate alpha-N-acetylglucosaminyl 1-phosphate transferase [Candidatus Margulisiibacteriota bacterium]